MESEVGVQVFLGLCLVSAVICGLLGRFFPQCLLQKAIQWVLYGVSIGLVLIGTFVWWAASSGT